MIVTDDDADKAMKWLIENAARTGQAIAEAEYMKEYRKSMKAMLMEQSGQETVGMQERYAYAHPDYREHLLTQKAAVAEAEKLKFLAAAARVKIDLWRTDSANARVVR